MTTTTTTAVQASIDELLALPHTLTEVRDEDERVAKVLHLAQKAKALGHELLVVSPYSVDDRVRAIADVFASTAEQSVETLVTLGLLQVEECCHPGNPITLILTDLRFLEHARDSEATNAVQTAVKVLLMRGHENGIHLRLIK